MKARVKREIEEQVERDERSYIPDPSEWEQYEEEPRPPGDHITIDRDAQGECIGFTIFLEVEGKSIFMPKEEARDGIPFIDSGLLNLDPQGFAKKYRNAMIVEARRGFESGKLGNQEDMDDYLSDDLTPEQRQVLRDL